MVVVSWTNCDVYFGDDGEHDVGDDGVMMTMKTFVLRTLNANLQVNKVDNKMITFLCIKLYNM